MEYRDRTVYNLEYHIAWVTRWRHKVLTGEVALRARELIRQSCLVRDIAIIRGTVAGDHVHLLVSCPPALSPATVVKYLKERSSGMLQEEFPHLRKRYRGQVIWGRGYFCATVGSVTEDEITEYVENQQVEGPGDTFRIQE